MRQRLHDAHVIAMKFRSTAHACTTLLDIKSLSHKTPLVSSSSPLSYLDGLDHSEALAGLDSLSYLRQIHEHHIAQLGL